jgi:hypothetical protein
VSDRRIHAFTAVSRHIVLVASHLDVSDRRIHAFTAVSRRIVLVASHLGSE